MNCLPCQRAHITAAPASTQGSGTTLAWAGILAVLGGFFALLLGRKGA